MVVVQGRNPSFHKSNKCKIPEKEEQRIVLQGESLAGRKTATASVGVFEFPSPLRVLCLWDHRPFIKTQQQSLPEGTLDSWDPKDMMSPRERDWEVVVTVMGAKHSKEVLEYRHWSLTLQLLSPSLLFCDLQRTSFCVLYMFPFAGQG